MVSILIVAEKPSIARKLNRAFSISFKMKFEKKKGKSRYNPIFEAEVSSDIEELILTIEEQKIALTAEKDTIIITSVTGHVLTFEYESPYDKQSSWKDTDPEKLISLTSQEIPQNNALVEQLSELGKHIDILVIATDWDSHGESIGGQIVRIVSSGRSDNSLIVGRMRFVSTSVPILKNSFLDQHLLDEYLIKSVDSLRQQDLRMGASLTRFLSVGMELRGSPRLISYGPCQSSVLWIIAKRYEEKMAFKPAPLWHFFAVHSIPDLKEFELKEGSISDPSEAERLNLILQKLKSAKFYQSSPSNDTILRPKPLDTDTLESEGSRLFRVSPKLIADIAEKLYNNEFITYPRTESSYYLQKDLTFLVERFNDHPIYGSIANICLSKGQPKNPSKGRFTKDHEPIRPVKAATEQDIRKTIRGSSFEKNLAFRIYDYIVRRFFATVFNDALVRTIDLELREQEYVFVLETKNIIQKGFLEFYPFRRVKETTIPDIKDGTSIDITVEQREGFTKAPLLWTESQLIREMSRLGIGTDATRSSHLDTVTKRNFSKLQGLQRKVQPTTLGFALYQIFEKYASDLIQPQIRSTVENWTHQIREKKLTPTDVDRKVIELTTTNLRVMKKNKEDIFSKLQKALEVTTGEGQNFGKCSKCKKGDLLLRVSLKGKRFFECSNRECKNTLPAPRRGEMTPTSVKCTFCETSAIQVGTGTKTWWFCPICWTLKATKSGPFFCSVCNADCELAGPRTKQKEPIVKGTLGKCDACDEGVVQLIFKGTITTVRCSSCSKIWKAPNIRLGTQIIIDDECRLCGRKTLQIKRKGKQPYNMCLICQRFCFQCQYQCYS